MAVAANFTKPAEELAAAFKAKTGDDIVMSFGATGALYAQITQGAPFEVLLAADARYPALTVDEGFGVEDTVFTYAVGKVVLYSPVFDVSDGKAVLEAGVFHHLAIADPTTAPYGAAAIEVIDKLGLREAIAPTLVTGGNVSQALQFIDTGNAELGFVSLSQVIDKAATQVWLVPADLHAPILQDAVLLKTGEAELAARAFLDFLRSEDAGLILESYGYEVPKN